MLRIICGENTVASRQHLLSLKQDYRKKGYEVKSVPLSDLSEIQKSGSGMINLFGQETVYIVEKVSSKYKGRGKSEFKDTIEALSKSEDLIILDWEEGKSAYELSTLKKHATSFDEFKPEKSIFQLLEICQPGQLQSFITTLHKVHDTQDEMFIYTLLWKHIRKLIQAKEQNLDASVSPWQRKKLQTQSQAWTTPKLLGFYEGLAKIDIGMKTGQTTFGIVESIEILACFYLK